MAAVDPYSPCPCGSGQKFKWCCHKVEAQVERAQRLFSNGQVEAAVHALDEALSKEPGNAWLLMRKAVYQIRLGQVEPAMAALRQVLATSPKHPGALMLLTRLVLETEGPEAGVGQFQQALSSLAEGQQSLLGPTANLFGLVLIETGHYPAGIRHLLLGLSLGGRSDDGIMSIRSTERSPGISAWLRNPYLLDGPPADLSGAELDRFKEAMAWADAGLWSSAAAAFEVISAANGAAGAAAERNLGLCRLWLADEVAAVAALRRAIARLGNTVDAVDLEALCQNLEMPEPDDLVEQVQLIWPLRDRERLLKALRADRTIEEDMSGPIDPHDPESPEVERFGLLDRPRIDRTEGLRIEDMPRFVGRVFVGQELAGIETYDDGRLDGLVERFTDLAEGAIPPAHPKTKVLDKVVRATLALSWEWQFPEELSPAEESRLDSEQGKRMFEEVWPATAMPYLKGRTPLEAARAGDAVVPLRAAVLQQELSPGAWGKSIDFASVRARLGLEPEPPIDPETVDIERVHIARLAFVPADRLDDDRLVALYRRASRFAITYVLEQAARALIERPHVWQAARLSSLTLFADVALAVSLRGLPAEAFEWVARGRRADPPAEQTERVAFWDMIEIRIRAKSQPPEEWIPELAVILERYKGKEQATQAITLGLIELGLVRLVPNPDDPRDVLLDSRALQMLMAEYGPRVTTASGSLGVSATKEGIWTPGGPSSAGGTGIWTPGSQADRPSGGESKLIIPGR